MELIFLGLGVPAGLPMQRVRGGDGSSLVLTPFVSLGLVLACQAARAKCH